MKFKGFRHGGLLLIFLLISNLVVTFSSTRSLRAEDFANPAFKKVWEESDRAVADHRVNRPWLWGDAPFASQQELYDEASGNRLVQYFDKSRMELTNPLADKNNPYFVTNGLLTKELVSGQMQVGDNRYLEGVAADIPVAGDSEGNPDCPTYATFGQAELASLKAGDAQAQDLTGQRVVASLNHNGEVATLAEPPEQVNYAHYSPELGHNIPGVFWNWLNRLGVDWLFALGYPISEPYWSQVRVAGVDQVVLMQLFERRVLTFTPGNAPAWQVEMGNIGRHYYQWRYESGSASVLSYRAYKSEIAKNLYVVGVFQNDTNTEQRIQLTANLLDQDGQLLATSNTMIDALAIVPAKGKSPFRIILENIPENWDRVEFSAEFLPFFKTFKHNFNYDLSVADVIRDQSKYGLPRLSGHLTNLGQSVSAHSGIIGVAYDDDGKVLDLESGYTDPQKIEPGASAPFELPFLRAKNFSKYEIFTEGRN
ncbi:MAG: hypothetical protein HXX20_07550 [Chloroflexi bacterium]|nr:hypothetical protein [Chloroflexota bacterium]